jgi:hypothetical protein
VRLTENVDQLVSGLVYLLPPAVAHLLIMHRKAVPEGNMGTFPDLEVSEEELEDWDFNWSAIQAVAA